VSLAWLTFHNTMKSITGLWNVVPFGGHVSLTWLTFHNRTNMNMGFSFFNDADDFCEREF
jgi:hypothetical protein